MLEAVFYLLVVAIALLLAYGFRKALINSTLNEKQRSGFMKGYWLVMGAWALYLPVLVATGVFVKKGLFPAIPLLVILPAFIIIIWFHTAKKFRPVMQAYSASFTVYFQTFRIVVELLILGLFLKNVVPVQTTFEGNNFDVLSGLTAPIIGWLAFSKKAISKKAVVVWNICCCLILANIVFIFMSLGVKPEIWGYTQSPLDTNFATVPYLYIASLYMPVAVFMHIMSFRKMLQKD
jgi:hypothetical protein